MRLSYLDEHTPTVDGGLVERIKQRRGGSLLALDKVLLHSPPVANGWNAFLGSIRNETQLEDATRELIASRVAGLNKAWYEWDPHHQYLIDTGALKSETVERLKDKSFTGAGLEKRYALIIKYVDSITLRCRAEQRTLDELKALYSERDIVEITATIAAFNAVTRFVTALDIGEKLEKYSTES